MFPYESKATFQNSLVGGVLTKRINYEPINLGNILPPEPHPHGCAPTETEINLSQNLGENPIVLRGCGSGVQWINFRIYTFRIRKVTGSLVLSNVFDLYIL